MCESGDLLAVRKLGRAQETLNERTSHFRNGELQPGADQVWRAEMSAASLKLDLQQQQQQTTPASTSSLAAFAPQHVDSESSASASGSASASASPASVPRSLARLLSPSQPSAAATSSSSAYFDLNTSTDASIFKEPTKQPGGLSEHGRRSSSSMSIHDLLSPSHATVSAKADGQQESFFDFDFEAAPAATSSPPAEEVEEAVEADIVISERYTAEEKGKQKATTSIAVPPTAPPVAPKRVYAPTVRRTEPKGILKPLMPYEYRMLYSLNHNVLRTGPANLNALLPSAASAQHSALQQPTLYNTAQNGIAAPPHQETNGSNKRRLENGSSNGSGHFHPQPGAAIETFSEPAKKRFKPAPAPAANGTSLGSATPREIKGVIAKDTHQVANHCSEFHRVQA